MLSRIHSQSPIFSLFFGVGFFLLFLGCIVPTLSHAQTRLEYSGAHLALDPRYPLPESSVTVSLNAYTYDTAGAYIIWKIDGVEQTAFLNERSITVRVGAMGDSQTVSATVVQEGQRPFTLSRVINPTTLDLIVEASSYVPPFYGGRALGSARTPLRIIAIANNGEILNPEELTYTWEHNETMLFGGPVRGKESVNITMPEYSGGYVKVAVFDSERQMVAETLMELEAITPEMHFYEENLLRGLSELAVPNKLALIGNETTVHGEPYYLAESVSTDHVKFEWTINREDHENTSPDPHVISLRRKEEGQGGSAIIGLRALTTAPLPAYVQEQFVISF